MGLLDIFSGAPPKPSPASTAGLLAAPNREAWMTYQEGGGTLSYADWAKKQQADANAAAAAAQKK